MAVTNELNEVAKAFPIIRHVRLRRRPHMGRRGRAAGPIRAMSSLSGTVTGGKGGFAVCYIVCQSRQARLPYCPEPRDRRHNAPPRPPATERLGQNFRTEDQP
jgi:hypothetical protein